MLKSQAILRIILFLFFLHVSLPTQTQAQLTYEEVTVGWNDAFGLRHLMAIPIYLQNPSTVITTPYINLAKGMKNGSVKVSERGSMDFENIRWLRVNNNSKQPLLLLGGEVLKGGRQDRMIAMDTVLMPSEKDQYVPVLCLEEGRWSKQEKPFTYEGFANNTLRELVWRKAKQTTVWTAVGNEIDRTGTKTKTKAYTAIRKQKEYQLVIQQYMQYFDQKLQSLASNTSGIIFLSGNKILGVELYGSEQLFQQQREVFLYGYVETAILRGSDIKISRDTLELYMKNMLRDEQWQHYFIQSRLGRAFQHNEQMVYLTGYQYEAVPPARKPEKE